MPGTKRYETFVGEKIKTEIEEEEEEADYETMQDLDHNDNDTINIDVNSVLNKEKQEINKKLDFIIDKTISYYSKLKSLYNNYSDINQSFEKLKLLDVDRKIEILWDYLIKNFKNNYEYIIENFSKIKKKKPKT